MNKLVLDATCSGRSMWFQKNFKHALFVDIRKISKGSFPHSPNFEICPDIQADFRDLPLPDKSFRLVVFDPPHLKSLDLNSWIGGKYGVLDPDTWREDIRKGFMECWRVLDDYGVLIFKWSKSLDGRKSRDISTAEILRLIHPIKPLFGHPSGSKINTIWMTFLKLPAGDIHD